MIKAEALRLGFDACGIAQAGYLREEAPHFARWLEKGYQGGMTYMEKNPDKRLDPRKLVEGTKSVISVLLNYFPASGQQDPEAPVVSKYAYGGDYHDVIRGKLNMLLRFINSRITPVSGRAFTDSAPVLDKAWAARSGLGWIGKNTCLISPVSGSWSFIGSLMVDIPLAYDTQIQDFCGDCNRCIRACPTRALTSPRLLDSNRCIAYLTIEHRGEIDPVYGQAFRNRVFGCDICQDVCPWNHRAKSHQIKEFEPLPGLLEMARSEWLAMDETAFTRLFSKSAIKRTAFTGLKRNLNFIAGPTKGSEP
jgi:epoxyqueuosine reductase